MASFYPASLVRLSGLLVTMTTARIWSNRHLIDGQQWG